jgi:hypothetical protein
VDVPDAVGERPVFSAGERTYTWLDVVQAAEARGDVAAVEHDLAVGTAALDEVELDANDVDAAGTEFRRGLGLLAAEEMEAWLSHWEITAGDWVGFLRRRLARGLAPDARGGDPGDALWAEAVCSGALSSWAWELAGRAAAGGEDGDPDAYDELVRRANTPEARAKTLESKQMDWLRVECDLLELPVEGMAREAALCVREDGLSLDEVAGRAGVQVAERAFLLMDAPTELADPLLSARPGDLVGPVSTGDGFFVALVRDKRAPSLDDPAIGELLDVEVPRRAIDSEVKKWIRWHEHV